jgi:hypothetical protein
MRATICIDALLSLCVGCTSPEANQLNQQDRDQIKNDVVDHLHHRRLHLPALGDQTS